MKGSGPGATPRCSGLGLHDRRRRGRVGLATHPAERHAALHRRACQLDRRLPRRVLPALALDVALGPELQRAAAPVLLQRLQVEGLAGCQLQRAKKPLTPAGPGAENLHATTGSEVRKHGLHGAQLGVVLGGEVAPGLGGAQLGRLGPALCSRRFPIRSPGITHEFRSTVPVVSRRHRPKTIASARARAQRPHRFGAAAHPAPRVQLGPVALSAPDRPTGAVTSCA